MSLTSTTTRVNYSGNSSTTVFPITFSFWSSSDLSVILTVTATGVQTAWVLGSQFTVTGGAGSTGTLTVTTSPTDNTPATGTTLAIISALPNTQPTVLPVGGNFPSATVEQELDQIVRQGQQISKRVDRSMVQPDGDTADIAALPAKVTRASMTLGFNSAGDPIAVAGASGGTLINAAMVDVVQAASHSAAAVLLGITAIMSPVVGASTVAVAAGLLNASLTKPTRTVLTSGTAQTYTKPAGATRLNVRMVGGGAGGAGSGTTPGAAGAGVDTTFGTALLTAKGGGAPSTSTGGSGTAGTGGDINLAGGDGQSTFSTNNIPGGAGGTSVFGGSGPGGAVASNGGVAKANTGGGGGGAGQGTTSSGGGGGASGSYCEKLLTTLLSTYAYTVGTGGIGGTLGTSGAAGGAGGSGIIIVDEFYD